ncbi:hypothetical protein [Prauserella endophytica]|uniref:hypothetical protein n=1 Tax=Prauserella endophytica TaxID=1592324 RepID=UPI000D97E0DA|nr:hypothetical protein [Prauserella endophytica]PXY23527.1 hypothetical protein BAY59_28125 [Prauserella coralliicola]
MKGGAQVAAAVGAGYLLGRTRKMRLALMIAAAGATGKLGGAPRELLQQGVKRLAASPELSKITDSVRGDLVDAARSAAMAAASSRIDSLNDRLQGVRAPGTGKRDEAGAAEDEDYIDAEEAETEEEPGEDEEAEDTGELEDTEESEESEEPEPEEEEEPEPPRRRRAAQTRSAASRSSQGRTTRTRATPARGRAPVRRTGR